MTIRRRTRDAAARPWVTREDLAFAAELPWLAAIALTVPETRWQAACRRLEVAKARLRWFDPGPVARTAARVLGNGSAAFDARAFALDSAAGRSEHHVQILRELSPRGWTPRLALEGPAHVDDALAAGRGAVLWVAHFCFNALATKKALAGAGHRAWHVSRPEHGFSKSRVGIATVNRLRVRAFPFHSSVTSFVADHDFVFVVEQNRDAQLRSLIVNECGIDPIRLVPILHYDGTPITARFIAHAIGDHLEALKVTPLRKVVS